LRIGESGIPGEEYFEILSLRFNIGVARKLSARHDLTRVEPLAVARWLEHARILESMSGTCRRTPDTESW
jgi:hypothetical protein